MADRAITAVPFTDIRLTAVKRSQQWSERGNRFVNELPREPFEFWASIGKSLRGTEHSRPEGRPPVVLLSAADFAAPPASGLRITWLGHSTTLVEIYGVRLLLDPMLSERSSPFECIGPRRFQEPPLALEELERIPLDAVVISHDHYDHLDRATIEALRRHVPRLVVPLGVGAYLEAWGVSPECIVERDWWEETEIGSVKLVATPARHFSGRSLVMARPDRTLWSGWAILGPRHRVYYSGDTGMFPGFAEIGERLGPFDATLIESGAYDELWADVHLGPEQALLAHTLVRGRLFIPVHWGTFNLGNHSWVEPAERALEAAGSRSTDIAIPRPGESIEPGAPCVVKRWWPDLPWQSAREAPVRSSGLSETR